MIFDTRIDCAIADLKAGAAAIDDGRAAIAELLDEGPRLHGRDLIDLERARGEYNKLIERADALLGLMSRLDDRLAPIEEKQL